MKESKRSIAAMKGVATKRANRRARVAAGDIEAMTRSEMMQYVRALDRWREGVEASIEYREEMRIVGLKGALSKGGIKRVKEERKEGPAKRVAMEVSGFRSVFSAYATVDGGNTPPFTSWGRVSGEGIKVGERTTRGGTVKDVVRVSPMIEEDYARAFVAAQAFNDEMGGARLSFRWYNDIGERVQGFSARGMVAKTWKELMDTATEVCGAGACYSIGFSDIPSEEIGE